jgi:hypothetical protein
MKWIYTYMYHIFFLHSPFDGNLGYFHFWLLSVTLLLTLMCNFLKIFLFSKEVKLLYIPTYHVWGFNSYSSTPTFITTIFFNIFILKVMKQYLIVVFIYFWLTSGAEYLLMCLLVMINLNLFYPLKCMNYKITHWNYSGCRKMIILPYMVLKKI